MSKSPWDLGYIGPPGIIQQGPEFWAPAPPPFLPLPRGLIMKKEGLDGWAAYGIQGNELVSLGEVFGEDEEEALEAAKEAGKGLGIFSAYKVVEMED